MNSTLSIAQSGLTGAAASLSVGAHNVANTLTDGFVALRTDAKDQPEGGVKVSISKDARSLEHASVAGNGSGTDLAQEATNRISAVAAYRANIKSVQAADDTSGVVLHMLANPPE